MPGGDKASYIGKQKRKTEHIEEGRQEKKAVEELISFSGGTRPAFGVRRLDAAF